MFRALVCKLFTRGKSEPACTSLSWVNSVALYCFLSSSRQLLDVRLIKRAPSLQLPSYAKSQSPPEVKTATDWTLLRIWITSRISNELIDYSEFWVITLEKPRSLWTNIPLPFWGLKNKQSKEQVKAGNRRTSYQLSDWICWLFSLALPWILKVGAGSFAETSSSLRTTQRYNTSSLILHRQRHEKLRSIVLNC
jgi:hypothetical protein